MIKRLLILLALVAAPAMAQQPTLIPECQDPLPFQCPTENYTCSVNLQLKVCRQNIWWDFTTVATADQSADYTWTGKHTWNGGANHILYKGGTTDGFYFNTEDVGWAGIRSITVANQLGPAGNRYMGLWAYNPTTTTQNALIVPDSNGFLSEYSLSGTPVTWNIAALTQCSVDPNGGKLTMSAGGVISCQADQGGGGPGGGVEEGDSPNWTGAHTWEVPATSTNFAWKDTQGDLLYFDIADIANGQRYRFPSYATTLLFAAGWVNNPAQGQNGTDLGLVTTNGDGNLLYLAPGGTKVTWNLPAINSCSTLNEGGKLTMTAAGVIQCADDVAAGVTEDQTTVVWLGNHSWRAKNVFFRNDADSFSLGWDVESLGANTTWKLMGGPGGTVYPAFWADDVDTENHTAGVPAINATGGMYSAKTGTTSLAWNLAANDGCASLEGAGKLTVDAGGNIICANAFDPTVGYTWTGTHNWIGAAVNIRTNNTVWHSGTSAGSGDRFRFLMTGTGIADAQHDINISIGGLEGTTTEHMALTAADPTSYAGLNAAFDSNGNLVGGAAGGGGLVACTNTGAGILGLDADEDGNCEQYLDPAAGCIGFDYNDDGAGNETCGTAVADIVFKTEGRQVNLQSESYTIGDALTCPAGGGACTANYSDFPYHAFYSQADVIELGCWCEGTYSVAPQLTIANATDDGVLGTFTCSTGTIALTYDTPDAAQDDFTKGQQITLTPNTPTALAGPTTRACQISMAWDVKE